MTNFEKIKQMSVNELAEFMTGIRFAFSLDVLKLNYEKYIDGLNEKETKELSKWFDDSNKEQKQWLESEADNE